MKPLFYLFVALVPVVMIGCSGNSSTKASTEEVSAFAPGTSTLSPEAQAAKEKNESDLRARQAQQAQKGDFHSLTARRLVEFYRQHLQRFISMTIRPDTTTSEGGYTPSIENAVSPEAECQGVTARVVLLCLGLAVLFGIVIPLIDVKMSNTFLGATHLPPGAIGVLLILLLVVNPLLGMLSRRGRFSRNETLVVYISCLFSCLVPGHGSENLFVSNLVGPFYFATRENGWLDFLGPNLKPWFTPAITDGQSLVVGGNSVVQAWYTGAQVGGAFVPWGAWLVPLVAWGQPDPGFVRADGLFERHLTGSMGRA